MCNDIAVIFKWLYVSSYRKLTLIFLEGNFLKQFLLLIISFRNTQIWFDDIDKTFIELESNNAKSSILSQNSDKPKPTTINFVPKEHSTVANRLAFFIFYFVISYLVSKLE